MTSGVTSLTLSFLSHNHGLLLSQAPIQPPGYNHHLPSDDAQGTVPAQTGLLSAVPSVKCPPSTHGTALLPNTVLGSVDTKGNEKDMAPALAELTGYRGGTDVNQVIAHRNIW